MSTDLTITAAPLTDRMDYAKALAASSLIPDAFRGKPANALVAIEYGNALGIAPIVALSEINVIGGTPALSASLMAALARQAGHKVRVTGDAESATAVIVRADDPEHEHTATWTRKKAEDAKLWGRGHWAKDPGTMLRWRAIAEAVRFACSEVLGGLKYTPEEVVEAGEAVVGASRAPAGPVTSPAVPATRSGGAALRAAVAPPEHTGPVPRPEPDVVDAEVVEDAPAADPLPFALPATPEQRQAVINAARELDVTEASDVLEMLTGLTGREITSTGSLTGDEADAAVTKLQQIAGVAA